MSLKTMFDTAKNWLKKTVKTATTDDVEKEKNKVIRRVYVIETNVKQMARGVKAGVKKQYVEYVEGTVKSYCNVLSYHEFQFKLLMLRQKQGEFKTT